MPDLAAAAGVERVDFVDRGDVHDAVGDDRRELQTAGVGQREHPARREARDVALVDLRERRVTVPAGIAVVPGPRDVGGDLAHAVSRLPQQSHAPVSGSDLEVVVALADDASLDRSAVGGPERTGRRQGLCVPFDRTQETDERGELGLRHRVRRHAARRDAVVHERAESGVVAGLQPLEDRRSHLGAAAVGPVAAAAARLERPAARRGILGGGGERGQREDEADEQRAHAAKDTRAKAFG
jgi:hypothetical protein